MADLGDWLEQHGLGKYAGAFAAQEIDLDVLPELSEADLETPQPRCRRRRSPTGSGPATWRSSGWRCVTRRLICSRGCSCWIECRLRGT
jgi:hypothetical protein